MIVFLLIHFVIIFLERFTYMTQTKIKKRGSKQNSHNFFKELKKLGAHKKLDIFVDPNLKPEDQNL